MNNCRVFIVAFLLSILSFAHAEPKAYELVKYSGKVAGVAIAFDFGDGYAQASEIRITEGGKTRTFRLDDSGNAVFVPAKAGGAVKSVTLKMDLENANEAPDKVSGSYVTGGKTVPFTLRKRE